MSYEEIRYEGYGIGGAAIIVDTMTDNRVRTVAEVRHAFAKHGGNMGTEGSVAFQFKHCGQFVFAPGTSEDQVMEVALEAGAEDVVTGEDGAIEVLTSPQAISRPSRTRWKRPASDPNWPRSRCGPRTPSNWPARRAPGCRSCSTSLEDLDDVQDVFHNARLRMTPSYESPA